MNRNDFNRFISEDAVPGSGDLGSIRELTDLFPWFHAAHLVLLRGLKESSDIKFESQLKSSALYVPDREVLYHYLFLKPSLHPGEVHESVPVSPDMEVHENMPEVKETDTEFKSDIVTGNITPEEISLRSREELLAEIESRLDEISVTIKTPDVVREEEKEASADLHEVTAQEEIAGVSEIPEIADNIEAETVFEIELEPNYSAPEADRGEKFMIEDEELLELTSSDDEEVENEEPAPQLAPADLIDRFIKTSPRLERATTLETGPVRDLSETSAEEGGSFITETLARIYVNQGYYFKAINIYEKLTLKYPEKSAYFASRIEKIKDLIK